MKYMIISDIHGDINNLNIVLDIYLNDNCNKLIILGDLFNYGIDIKREDIINKLNKLKNDIIYVRGNCDNNINGILFSTPYSENITILKKTVFLNHGHLYSKEYLLGSNYDVIITGHTHIPHIYKEHNKLFLNPGSISKSRLGPNSFMLIDSNKIYIKDLKNNIIQKSEI